MYSTPVHSDFSLPRLRELLSDGHDAKLIMTLTRVLTFYILILRTARNMPTTVCMSLLSKIVLINSQASVLTMNWTRLCAQKVISDPHVAG